MRDILEILWDQEVEWGNKNHKIGYELALIDNKSEILSEVERQFMKFWGRYKNKKPSEFDGVVWKYDEIGVSIEYQLYYDNEGEWYMNAIAYPDWDQPGFPDDDEYHEICLTIYPRDIKSIIRNEKIESLGI